MQVALQMQIMTATLKTKSASAITVDYGLPLEHMIAAGRYDWIDDDITAERFPVKGEGVAEFETKLFRFDVVSSGNAIKEIEAQGWQAAGIEHLLSFGAANPDEQRKYPIVALGSIGRGRWRSPRAVSRRGRFEARPQPALVGRWLGFRLSFPCRPQTVSALGLLKLGNWSLGLLDPWSRRVDYIRTPFFMVWYNIPDK